MQERELGLILSQAFPALPVYAHLTLSQTRGCLAVKSKIKDSDTCSELHICMG